jgi:hypothetical protein
MNPRRAHGFLAFEFLNFVHNEKPETVIVAGLGLIFSWLLGFLLQLGGRFRFCSS